MKIKAAILILFVVLLGCKKGRNSNILLTGKLTDCPSNAACTYNFYDNADLANGTQVVAGGFSVFKYQSVNNNSCGPSTQLYFKAPMNNGELEIDASQIAAGQIVAYDLACPCCYTFAVSQPIGGEIKGRRINSNYWLINASIVFGYSGTPTDTLVVNQYFSVQKRP